MSSDNSHDDPFQEMNSSNQFKSSETFEDKYIVNIEDGEFDFDENADDYNDEGLDIVEIPSENAPPKRKRERKNVSRLLDEISTEPVSVFTSDANDLPSIEEDESTAYVRTVVRAIDERKGENIVAFRVSKLTYITSFVVIASANNTPQMRAISNLVEEDLHKKHDIQTKRKDGVPESGWILLDYGDFMVNIFSGAQRRNYNLETLWQKAELVDISDCIVSKSDEVTAEASGAALDDWLSE
ncbi:Protein Iojap/ribosomal silencing factor RsfS [Gracilaria domingensis]|nr:Protein Iojap/ribosomal silencing factor RsfS [Gracilaria domingensis]